MSFNHRDQTTPENAWVRAGVLNLPTLPTTLIPETGTLLVLAAHPDDEALGAASLLAHTRDKQCHVVVLLFTAGEKSHPRSPTHSPVRLAAIRLQEFATALTHLSPSAITRFFEFPDGSLPRFRERIVAETIAAVSAANGPVTVVAPYSGDGHGDHEVVGAAALDVGLRCHVSVLEYPIWYWHWASTDDRQWSTWAFLPDPPGLNRQALLSSYPSQTMSLSNRPGDEAILTPEHLEHFTRGGDTFRVTTSKDATPPSVVHQRPTSRGDTDSAPHDAHSASRIFDEVHHERTDPWNVHDSDYELAKRAELLRHLPRIPFAHTLEIGCSIGVLSRELARRSKQVTALDASREALKIATALHRGTGVEFVHATVPFQWPAGHFDCVVLSETGFYLSQPQLHQTLQRIDESTPSQFVLVLCHWTGEIHDWPLNADEVHERCLSFWPGCRLEFHTFGQYRLYIATVTKASAPLTKRGQ